MADIRSAKNNKEKPSARSCITQNNEKKSRQTIGLMLRNSPKISKVAHEQTLLN